MVTRQDLTRAVAVSVGVVLLLVSMPVSGVAAPKRSTSGIPDVITLFGRAVRIVRAAHRPRYSRAIVLEADGITRGGKCTTTGCFGGRGTTSASGIVSWRFVFDNQSSPKSRLRSATIFYGPRPKRFGKVTGYRGPFTGDFRIRKAPRMTLVQAVRLLRRAKYTKKFFNVTLRRPIGPKSVHPLYIFGFASHSFVAVDAVSRTVIPFS